MAAKSPMQTRTLRTNGVGAAADPAFAAVGRWVKRHLGDSAHEHRVADIGSTLFDLTAPLHDLDARPWNDLLRLAALVNDVGRCHGEENHPADGAAMLLSATSLPLSADQRRALAYLTLYHRGAVPDLRDDDVLHPEDDAEGLLKVLALLRAADALDSRSLESPRLVFAWHGAGAGAGAGSGAAAKAGPRAATPRLGVTCYLQNDSAKARRVYQRRKKFRLLEDLLGCRVEVDIVLAQALRMVA
jgi:hypothetical protein